MKPITLMIACVALAAGLVITVLMRRPLPPPLASSTPMAVEIADDNSVPEVIANTVVAGIKGDLQSLYQVNYGDSLFSIARSHGVSVQAIKDANRDTNDLLVVDEWLVMPK